MDNPFLEITIRQDDHDIKLQKIEQYLVELIDLHKSISNASSLLPHPEETMNVKEVAAYLKVSKSTIRRYKDNGVLPFYKASRTVLFKRSEVDVAMSSKSKIPKK